MQVVEVVVVMTYEYKEQAKAEHSHDVSRQRQKEEEEVPVVPPADAVVHPRAVVIKVLQSHQSGGGHYWV